MLKEVMEYVKVRYLGEKGQGIVEYALILAFVVVVAAAISDGGNLRERIAQVFTDITNAFGTSNGGGGN